MTKESQKLVVRSRIETNSGKAKRSMGGMLTAVEMTEPNTKRLSVLNQAPIPLG